MPYDGPLSDMPFPVTNDRMTKPGFARRESGTTSTFRGRVRAASGAAAVELIVVTPLLMLLAWGAGDFGRLMYAGIVLSHAARAGAAYGSQDNGSAADFAGIAQAARDEAVNLGTIGVTPRLRCECENGGVVDCINTITCVGGTYGVPRVFTEVETTYTFSTLLSLPLVPNTVALTKTARIRVQ